MTPKKAPAKKASKKAAPKASPKDRTQDKRFREIEARLEEAELVIKHVRQVFIKQFGFDPSEVVYREDAVAEFAIPARAEDEESA